MNRIFKIQRRKHVNENNARPGNLCATIETRRWPQYLVAQGPKRQPPRPAEGFAWRKLITELAQHPLPEQHKKLGATWAEAVVKKAFSLALEGNVAPALPEPDPTQLRREVEVNLQRAKLAEERKLREALLGDPAKLQELIDLQTPRLELESRIHALATEYLGDADAEPRGNSAA